MVGNNIYALCGYNLSTTIAGVSFIMCGKLYFRQFLFLANPCLVVKVSILIGCLCVTKLHFNICNIYYVVV